MKRFRRQPEIFIFRIAINLLLDHARRTATHRMRDHTSLNAIETEYSDDEPMEPALIEDRGTPTPKPAPAWRTSPTGPRISAR